MRRLTAQIGMALCMALTGGDALQATPLDDYVKKPDPNHGFRVVQTLRGDGGTAYLLTFLSQAWRTGAEVDRILWRHWLEVYVPDDTRHDAALLRIGGGVSGDEPPKLPNRGLARLALETNSVTAFLHDVPNQPLCFMGDPDLSPRVEDEILAFSFARFMESDDPAWLALLPMVKSTTGAMDAITTFSAGLPDHPAKVARYVLHGYSKRGWTTWLTAAVDSRVAGAGPAVIEMLNVKASLQHQFRAYGQYAAAVHDYVDNGLMDVLEKPEFAEVARIIDPFSYRERLTMPKLILNSAGDEFFLPDSWRFYWDELPGLKHMRTLPNTRHGLNASADETLQTFYECILTGRKMPRLEWRTEGAGRIVVTTTDIPLSVAMWSAHNPKARDFRLESIGETWRRKKLTSKGGGVFSAELSEPATGWSAFLVEVVFPDPNRAGRTVTLTSGVSVVPDRLPYELPK